MAFPAVAGTNTSSPGSSTTTHSVSLPASIAAGDLLVVYFGGWGGGTLTWPAGWTPLFDTSNGTAARLAAAYRFADGSEGGSISVTSSTSIRSAHISYRITGAHSSTAPVVGTATTGTSAAGDPPSLSPAGGAKDYLWLAGVGFGSTTAASAAPANYTNLLTRNDTNAGVGSARRELNASSENPGGFTNPFSSWVANVVAIYPGPDFRNAAVAVAGASSCAIATQAVSFIAAPFVVAASATVGFVAGLATFVPVAAAVAATSAAGFVVGVGSYIGAAVAVAGSSAVGFVAGLATAVDAAVSIAAASVVAFLVRITRAFIPGDRVFVIREIREDLGNRVRRFVARWRR